MEMIKLIVFVLSILVLPSDQATSQPTVSKCLQNSTDPNITLVSTYGKWCYFVEDGSWNATNYPSGNGSYVFNISKAREICEAEDATLLIIHNMEENKHISDQYHKLSPYLALGLKQHLTGSKYSYEWDDGSNLTLKYLGYSSIWQPDVWENEDNQASFTIFKKELWMNVAAMTNLPVFVVCQQQVHQIPSTPTTPSTSPPPVPFPICDQLTYSAFTDDPSYVDMSDYAVTIFPNIKTFTNIPGNTYCYFVVDGAESAANKLENGSYFFNMTTAREICAQHNATLPSIHNLADDLSVWNNVIPGSYVLGLQQVAAPGGFEYKWDDGSQFDYEPLWKTKYQPATFAVSLTPDTEYEYPMWQNALDQVGFKESIKVICQQPYPSKPKTPNQKFSNCNSPHKDQHGKVAVFDGKWCYFVNSEFTWKFTNKFDRQTNESYFNPGNAREYCHKISATLPTISSPQEHRFIQENFNPELFVVGYFDRPEPILAKMIMLDLKQVKNVTDFQWADNGSFSFKPKIWGNSDFRDRDKYAFFTVMDLEKEEWVNFGSANIVAPVGVLCKQPHFPEADTTSMELATRQQPSTEDPPPPTTKPEPKSPTLPQPPHSTTSRIAENVK